LEIALQRAETLPSFDSQAEAERVLLQLRDDSRQEILRLAEEQKLVLDLSPESLKTLERWYFERLQTEGFARFGLTKEQFEQWMGIYLCCVFVENKSQFSWVVQESTFAKGKYEIGVTKGLMTILVGRMRPPSLEGNKRMQSMYREYQKLASL
jgi:hypothetical protein